MAKYTTDANLIKGAGVAYKNYDNVPGMYKGLDDVISTGTKLVDDTVKEYEKEQARIKLEDEKAKAEKQRQDADWFRISGDVYANAGSFMKDVEYKETAAEITALKQRYIDAQKSGNPEEMAAVQIEFNKIKQSVDNHKAFRESITNPDYGLSEAVKNSGVAGGDGGQDLDFLTGLVDEKYKIVYRDDDDNPGKKIKKYMVNYVAKSMKEIEEMAVLKDIKPFQNFINLKRKYAGLNKWNSTVESDAIFELRNTVIPKTYNGLRAFVADDSNGAFGNGKNLTAVMNDPNNKASIKKQIDMAIFNTNDEGASKGVIDENEYKEFVLAVTDAKHKFWNDSEGKPDKQSWQTHTTEIVTDLLLNATKNSWTNNQPVEKEEGLNPTGFLNTKKGVNLGTLGMSFGYNVSKNMYDQFKLSSEGKPAEFSIGKTNFRYDVENNNWIQTKADGSKKNLGDINAALGPKGFAIVDPDFLALRTTAEIMEDSDVDFDITDTKRTKSETAGVVSTWSSKIDMSFVNEDDNVVARELQKLMPTAFDVDKNPLGYKFMNLKSVGAISGQIGAMGDFTKEAVGLYSDDGKTHITYPVGHEKDIDENGNPGEGKIPVIIYLGSDQATRKEAIATIDAIVNTPQFKIGKPKLK